MHCVHQSLLPHIEAVPNSPGKCSLSEQPPRLFLPQHPPEVNRARPMGAGKASSVSPPPANRSRRFLRGGLVNGLAVASFEVKGRGVRERESPAIVTVKAERSAYRRGAARARASLEDGVGSGASGGSRARRARARPEPLQ